MKVKVLSTALLSLLMVFNFSSSPMASGNGDSEVVKYKQVTDLNELYERALNGISDLPEQEEKTFDSFTSTDLSEINSDFETQTNSTSQLLKVKNVNGKLVETYATTVFQVSQDATDRIEQEKQDNMIRPFASKSDDKWDSTYGVKAYATITWNNVYDSNQVKHFDLTRVTGGWSYDGAGGYVLSNRSAIVGQVGPGSFGSTSGQSKQVATSSNTYSYTVPASWKPVASTKYTSCGVSTNIKISRGSSSWTLPFTNHAN
ncbi:hypothetical protein [Metabacillus idriensis]|uniref:hypothetical protein n=1 Tax=Metabacillus idriensis TaxID=324768 RepID=UPI00174C7144|nr:hypothetical protein [Metabacillus idriensis]